MNDHIRRVIEYIESSQPITTYKEWKDQALQQGGYLEASRKKNRKPTLNNPSSARGNNPHKPLYEHGNLAITTAKERKLGPVSLPPCGGPWELLVVAVGVPDANRDRRTRRRLQVCLVPFSGSSWVVNTRFRRDSRVFSSEREGGFWGGF